MNKVENLVGFIVLVISLVVGSMFLTSDMLFFRWVMGIALGYTLTRSLFGFAGGVNRAYINGSTKLMRALMLMFVVSAILTTAFLLFSDAKQYDLWINPINLGLILGGLLFGFGMSFSSCCATGTLTDMVTALPRGLITLVFFCIGVFVGFPMQATQSWIKQSWFSSGSWAGVFIPDWFGSGTFAYIAANLVTILFAGIVVVISYAYEKKRRQTHTFYENQFEADQKAQKDVDVENYKLFSTETYSRLFVKPWSLTTGAIVISILFALLMGITKMGWGASTPYGFWFGRVLNIFGVDVNSITTFTGRPDKPFTMPFFAHPIYVQNIGIILGTIISLLLAGSFTKVVKAELKITVKDALIFAIGGFSMGFGTRLSNGCNVGALYTPIANFSLSGWIFLVFLVVGGFLGNSVVKKYRGKKSTCCNA